MADQAGLLFVYGEPGLEVSEKEFNDWYDLEHAPARLTVPGFQSAMRYKAVDSVQPTWLALYDLSSPSVTASEAYTGLRLTASQNERDVISRTLCLQRRVYVHLSTTSPVTSSTSLVPGNFLMVISIQTMAEESLNEWYEGEYMGLISKAPGFVRGRRWKLVQYAELGGKTDLSTVKEPYTDLALFEFENDRYMETPEMKYASSTPGWEETMKTVVAKETRFFELYKTFH